MNNNLKAPQKARVIAYYLPQFHPIPENDEWWGPGFTEWTNVVKAKPRFKGHVQPRIPADLGFYDLRLPETREKQAELAREAGIEGFCYYHYWFGDGKQLLERPFNEVVESGKPDFPFCLCWANHSWSGATWTNANIKTGKKMFMEQKYLGKEDNEKHFYSLLKAFKDPRYIKVDGKLFFAIYDALGFENVKEFMEQWQALAKKEGLTGFHFVGAVGTNPYAEFVANGANKKASDTVAQKRIQAVLNLGFDAVITDSRLRAEFLSKGILNKAIHTILFKWFHITTMNKFEQKTINANMYVKEDALDNVYPTLIPNWDRTPRSKSEAFYVNSTPKVFGDTLKSLIRLVSSKQPEHRIIILKSWNEWGEGNYVEPDLQYGHGYLDEMKDALK